MSNNPGQGQKANPPKKPDKKPGRPTLYSKKLALEICEKIAEGKSLVRILEAEGMPGYQTVLDWLSRDDEPYKQFSGMYARAREHQADFHADEIIDIADDSAKDTAYDAKGNAYCDNEWVNRSKLRVDARKWVASKLKPRKYGERINAELSGPDGGPIVVVDAGKDPYAGAAGKFLPEPGKAPDEN